MTVGITMGNVVGSYIIRANLTPAATGAASSAEQTFTAANAASLAALRVGDFVSVISPGVTAGIGIGGARVSAAGTLAINFFNCTLAVLQAPAGIYVIKVDRPEGQNAAAIISD